MQKTELLRQITITLKAKLQVLVAAARAAHVEATDDTSRAENKYDTRGLEAGYLAQGQARQAQEVADAILVYDALPPRDFAPTDAIDVDAVVRLEADGVPATYFLGPMSGGLEVPFDGETIVVITPQSPLGQSLMGRKSGQRWTAKIGGAPVQYRILSVA